MNEKPHAHRAEMRREFNNIQEGAYQLQYGDTRVRICREGRTPTERLVRRAFLRAVKKHDRGSQRAGQTVSAVVDLQQMVDAAAADGRWFA